MATNRFPPSSRYANVDTATFTTPEGREAVYLRRRFVPPPENFELLQQYPVREDERLDNITAQFLGDPEQFWRICDANGVMEPTELTATPGKLIRITLPEGIPGQRGPE